MKWSEVERKRGEERGRLEKRTSSNVSGDTTIHATINGTDRPRHNS